MGPDSAHAVLDAVRAARELADAGLGARTVVWGHSQGGGAALWTGALARDYAPDVPLDGVAALAPAANLPALVGSLEDVTGGSVFGSYVLAAYTATYPDVRWDAEVRPGAEPLVRTMARRCLSEPGVLASVLTSLALTSDPQVLARDPADGPFGARLAQNVPPPTAAAPPVLLAQGAADTLVTPEAQDDVVRAMCAAGQDVDHRTYPGLGHVDLVEADSPLVADLVTWTAERFTGTPHPRGCATARSSP